MTRVIADAAQPAQRGLDEFQLAHLRHIENLASQPDGDWSHMGGADPGQEWFDSYRYQLAKAAYALGLAHFHRLPAAPCVFKPVYQDLMRKMMRRDVWGYWKDTSQSGSFVDPGREQLRAPWPDPIVKENIMYSGHLHAMAGMYAVLFDDDRYAEPGALSLTLAPIFWGLGAQKFDYDFRSVNALIYWQMVESGWLGVACEPNCVFLICNQFPMLGFRFHDVRHGTSLAAEASASYRDAWDRKGMLDEDGHFYFFLRQKQDEFSGNGRAVSDAWLGAVMHAWNGDFVQSHYPAQSKAWFKRSADGLVSLRPPTVMRAMEQAERLGQRPVLSEDPAYTWSAPEFGFAAIWASEIGDQQVLDGLLRHADRYMQPTYERGGLYYPRNDKSWDEEGNMTYVDPLTGNVLIAYARLNVPHGLKKLYEQPFGAAHFAAPALVAMAPRVDVLRALFTVDRQLQLSVRGRTAVPAATTLTISNVDPGASWVLLRDGAPVASSDRMAGAGVAVCRDGDAITVHCTIGPLTQLSLCLE